MAKTYAQLVAERNAKAAEEKRKKLIAAVKGGQLDYWKLNEKGREVLNKAGYKAPARTDAYQNKGASLRGSEDIEAQRLRQQVAKQQAPISPVLEQKREQRYVQRPPVVKPPVTVSDMQKGQNLDIVQKGITKIGQLGSAYGKMLQKGPTQVAGTDPLSAGLAGAQRGVIELTGGKAPTTPSPISGQTFQQIQQQFPVATATGYATGAIVASLPTYRMANALVAKVPALAKLTGATSLGAKIAADQLLDTMVQSPGTVMTLIDSDMTVDDKAKTILKQQALNLAFNASLNAVGTAVGALSNLSRSTGKSTAEILSESPEIKTLVDMEQSGKQLTPDAIDKVMVPKAEGLDLVAIGSQMKNQKNLAEGINIANIRKKLGATENELAVATKPQQAKAPVKTDLPQPGISKESAPVFREPQNATESLAVSKQLAQTISKLSGKEKQFAEAYHTQRIEGGALDTFGLSPSRIKIIKDKIDKANLFKATSKAVQEPTVKTAEATPQETWASLEMQGVPVKHAKDVEIVLTGAEKERGLSKNIRTDIVRADKLRQALTENPEVYNQISNVNTLLDAEYIYNKGYDEALKEYEVMKGSIDPKRVPLGVMLADEATRRGDMTMARNIVSELADNLTQAGQFSQAARILRHANDSGANVLTLQKQIKRLNEEGRKMYGKKWTDVELTDGELTQMANAKGKPDEIESLMEQIHLRIARQIPSSNREKFDAFRRMAMLMNPKTHVRNILGNGLMKGLEKVADTVALGLEKAAKLEPGKRTKAFGWKKDGVIKGAVENAWEKHKGDIMKESRFDISGLRAFGKDKPTFKTKWLEWMNQKSKAGLEAEDLFFMKGAFEDALGQYMKANNVTLPGKDAIDYATKRAQEATFRQANALSAFIEQAKKKKGIGGMTMEALVPFAKTPANIAARAVDFSPIGFLKLLGDKNRSSAEVIDLISKGMTGTSLVGLGYLLAMNGMASGAYKGGKVAGLSDATGEQPMSIKVPFGDGTYTFDWAQPVAVPLAMGIAGYESMKEKNPDKIDAVAKAIYAGGDTIFNMTMLRNIKDLFSGYGSPTEKIAELPVDYIEQAFPTFFGQIARTVDTTKRSTYAPSATKTADKAMIAKTPGLSKTLEPALDIWGREQKQPGAVQQFVSPGTFKKETSDPATKEIQRLHELFPDDNKFIPALVKKKIGDRELTPKEVTEWQRNQGQESYKAVSKLVGSEKYKGLDDESKAKLIGNVLSWISERNKAKIETPKSVPPIDAKTNEKLIEIGIAMNSGAVLPSAKPPSQFKGAGKGKTDIVLTDADKELYMSYASEELAKRYSKFLAPINLDKASERRIETIAKKLAEIEADVREKAKKRVLMNRRTLAQ